MMRATLTRWLDRLAERLTDLESIQLALLALTLGSLGLGLGVVAVRLSLGLMLLTALVGVFTAWALTRARLSAWSYGLVGVLLGGSGLALTVGRLAGPLGTLAASLPALVGQLFQKEQPLDPSATVAAWQALTGALATLAARFGDWFRGVGAQTAVIDPTVTSILWGLALWLGAFWAAWWVRRRNFTLMGLLPGLALLGYNVFYTHSRIGLTWLALALGGMLLLQASAGYGAARRRWSALRLEQEQIEGRLVFLALALAVGMLLAGSLLPSVPVRKIADLVESAFQPQSDPSLAQALGLEATPDGDGPEMSVTPPVTGAQSAPVHALGPGPSLDSSLVMFVAVDGYQPPPDEYSQAALHYYWRAQAYDVYSGQAWSVTAARTDELAANQPLDSAGLTRAAPGQSLVNQQVTRLRASDTTVFAAGELLRLDQPATVARRADGELISAQAAGSYAALSRISSPSVEMLRVVGTETPAALRPFLALPDELPARVFDLALTLTADQPTSFDKALVLEAYLRQFPYSRQVPAPPAGRDAVDYFLFDLKTGYCDYYASAMVVMARAAGLPARLVLGYTQGVYDRQQGHFVVRASNAHAWVEIYFPNIGWVQFEPTPIQPLPLRPGQVDDGSHPTVSLPPPGQEARLSLHLERTRLGRLILALLGAAAVLACLPFLPLESWWLSLLPVERTFEAIFRRLYRRGRILGLPPTPARTPSDFARAAARALERFAADGQRASLAASLRADLDCLTNLYNRLLFSAHPLQEADRQAAIQAWARLRRGLRQIKR